MTFTDIKAFFQTNLAQRAALPWEPTLPLTPAELRAVRASLQTFQRGEGTGGDHLLDLARQYGVPDYAATGPHVASPPGAFTNGPMLRRLVIKNLLPRHQRMKNPFAQPHTLGEWLGSSLCWLVGSLGGWLALVAIGSLLFSGVDKEIAAWPTAGGLLLAHWLIWQKAVARGWRLLRTGTTPPSSSSALATLWFMALTLFQLCFLGMMLLGLAFGLSGPMVF